MGNSEPQEAATMLQKIVRVIVGGPKQLKDPLLFHKISLIPIMAWIGLGADGLSSSAYGPEEAFRALGEHTYLAVFLGLATALTVFIISYAYSRIIDFAQFRRIADEVGAYLLVDFDASPKVSMDWTNGPAESSIGISVGLILRQEKDKIARQQKMKETADYPGFKEMRKKVDEMEEQMK